MKNLQTLSKAEFSTAPLYTTNQKLVTLFLRHDEDKITVISGETVNLEIYDNGEPIFLGDKQELFEILKAHKKNEESHA